MAGSPQVSGSPNKLHAGKQIIPIHDLCKFKFQAFSPPTTFQAELKLVCYLP